MRLDKYLKTARILKRRTVAKDLADGQRVYINNRIAKPSAEVKEGDIIHVVFGQRHLEVRVLSVQEVKRKEEAVTMYEVLKEYREEEKTAEIT